MKLLRTIRLDTSDTFVFDNAAEPGEWAVAGSFVFWGRDIEGLEGKQRVAFRSGLLGVNSLGWSTLAQIVEADQAQRDALVDALAKQLVERFGAPDMATARASAEDEVTFTESLAVERADTLIAVRRTFENGDIREAFRTLTPRAGDKSFRAFAFFESDEEAEPGPEDRVDLLTLSGRGQK